MDYYKSGTLMPSDCDSKGSDPLQREGNHAVTSVGYGKSESKDCDEYWLIKNSWGTSWGEQGHFKLCADRKGDMQEENGPMQITSYIMWPSME